MDLGKIAKEVIKLKCPVHGESPVIKQGGKDVNFATCCKEFGEKIAKEFSKKAGEQLKKEVESMLKKR
jgi:hypothetical protein